MSAGSMFARSVGDAFGAYSNRQQEMERERAAADRQRKLDDEAAKRQAFAEYLQREQLNLSRQANERAGATHEAEQFGRGFTRVAPEQADGMAGLAPMAAGGGPMAPVANFLSQVGTQAKGSPGGWAKTNYSQGERKETNDLYTADENRKAAAARDTQNHAQALELEDVRAKHGMAQTLAGIKARAAASGAGQPPAAKTLPMGEVDKLTSQGSAIAQLDDVERILANPGKANTGLWPNVMGQRAANLVNKEGAELRAAIANISSLTYLDRSGAAVTPSEDARLAPLVPKDTDAPDVALIKLKKLRAHIARERATVADYYQQQGYAVPGGAKMGPPAPDVRNDAPATSPVNLNDPGFQDFLRQRGVR